MNSMNSSNSTRTFEKNSNDSYICSITSSIFFFVSRTASLCPISSQLAFASYQEHLLDDSVKTDAPVMRRISSIKQYTMWKLNSTCTLSNYLRQSMKIELGQTFSYQEIQYNTNVRTKSVWAT